MNSFGQVTLGLFLILTGVTVWQMTRLFGPTPRMLKDPSNYYVVRRWKRIAYVGIVIAVIGLVTAFWAVLRRWGILP